MSIIQQVYGSLKWKRSDEFAAAKLGISFEEYRSIKSKILMAKNDLEEELEQFMLASITNRLAEEEPFESPPNQKLQDTSREYKSRMTEIKENLEEGTAEIKGIAVAEPKSPDEIIRILKIDETVWKLSSYWNKQHRDHWLISAMVSRKKTSSQDLLLKTLETFSPQYNPVTDLFTNEKFVNPVVGILSIQDLHFGKEGNNDIIREFKEAIINLITRAYYSHNIHKIVYVVGGDLLNMDTFQGQTTKGTPVDNDQRAQDAYQEAFNTLYWSINYISQFCNELDVIYLPGNHDRLSSFHLAHGLSKCFKDSRISFNVDYAERKVVTWGENFFAFEHGDVSSKNTALVYATEFSKEWGLSTYRTCYTGHWHKKKTMEYVTEDEHHGFTIKHLPSLSKSDYWHYHNKFVGAKRQALIELHDVMKGKVCELTYNV